MLGNHGGKDHDAFLPFLDLASQLVPGEDSGDVRCFRLLAGDQQDIAERLCPQPNYVELDHAGRLESA